VRSSARKTEVILLFPLFTTPQDIHIRIQNKTEQYINMRLDNHCNTVSRTMKNKSRLAYATNGTQELQKTVVSQAMRRRRVFFDSADWILNGSQNEAALPIAHKEREHEAIAVKREKLQLQEVDMNREIKWNDEIKLADQESPVVQRAMHIAPMERKYFDSADWALGKDTVHTFHTYRNFPQPIPTHVVAQKRLHKSRKYFDSADWQLSGGVPQLYPKLNVLKN